jgi:amino acid transporter
VPAEPASTKPPELVRGLGLLQATALNITNMVGIGPFITIPFFIQAMEGPQAMIAWVLAAVLVISDGLIWSELGAALPGSGGTYHFFSRIFGSSRLGGLMVFLYIWQFLFTGTLEMASGYVGMSDYLTYIFPGLEPSLGPTGIRAFTAAAALLVTAILCRRIQVLGWLGVILWAGAMATVIAVIGSGITRFDASLIDFPEDAFRLDRTFASGLGAAMLIAVYDYLGYYNVCHLGDEVRNPARTIPRAVIISIIVVAAIYFTMNLCIIGVVPWREAMVSKHVAALFMERLFGRGAAVALTWMILWTALACLFSLTLGYSRIPYAAARNGDFFRPFAYVHPVGRYPLVSLLSIGGLTAVFCFLPLATLVQGAVTIRIPIQFLGQIAALHFLRTRRPDIVLPFRMRLYPLASLAAMVGWLFVFWTARPDPPDAPRPQILALAVIASGILAFALREAWRRRTGPSPPVEPA